MNTHKLFGRADTRRFQVIQEHLFSDLDGEAVILSLKDGKYYGLNEVGVSIWNLVKEPATVEEVAGRICEEYQIDRETCLLDVASFLRDMTANALVQIVDEKVV